MSSTDTLVPAATTATPSGAGTRANPRRGSAVGAALAVLVAVVLTACLPSPDSTNVDAVNALRASVAVPPLSRAGELDAKAKAHADRMADAGYIFHSSDLAADVPAGWWTIGENVAAAHSIEAAQAALEASPPHHHNMTNGAFNQVGVGVTERGGVYYVVQVFVGR